MRPISAAAIDRPEVFRTTFVGGREGSWRIDRVAAVAGEPLPTAERLDVRPAIDESAAGAWVLRGVTGAARYVVRSEKTSLDAASPSLDRPEATQAVLIPIRKSASWWGLPQDERRAIFEEKSHHISGSMKYLPRIARRLYHCRELGEPFDFLTWFEFAPEHASAFDELLGTLRATQEWSFVEREVEIRLSR
jgi:hypothetical protein